MRRRRIARYGAVGSGSVGLLGVFGWTLLWGEAKLARRAIPILAGAPYADGVFGAGDGPLTRLAMLGDSSGCGVGADSPAETPGAILAATLAGDLAAVGRGVLLEVAAVSGARSADLSAQVTRVLLQPPHVAVISIGANDVTHWVPPATAAAELRRAVERLVDDGVRVVVGTCPNLGAVRPIPQPLRLVAYLRSAQMAVAQRRAAAGAGATVVSFGTELGPVFCADPGLFCPDRFHPSGSGYGLIAAALLPAVRIAAGAEPGADSGAEAEPGGVTSADRAAAPAR